MYFFKQGWMSVQDSEFNDLVDGIFERLEDEVDEIEDDIDLEPSSGILTATFENGSAVILSRQIANHEIWVAAKSGGFHLGQDAQGQWYCNTTEETLSQLVSRVFTEQLGRNVSLLS